MVWISYMIKNTEGLFYSKRSTFQKWLACSYFFIFLKNIKCNFNDLYYDSSNAIFYHCLRRYYQHFNLKLTHFWNRKYFYFFKLWFINCSYVYLTNKVD